MYKQPLCRKGKSSGTFRGLGRFGLLRRWELGLQGQDHTKGDKEVREREREGRLREGGVRRREIVHLCEPETV